MKAFHIHLSVCVEEVEWGWPDIHLWLWGRLLSLCGVKIIEATDTGWLTLDCGPDGVHVLPTGDGVDHTTNKDACVCGPRVDLVRSDSGVPDSYVYVHASLDGRELTEG